jgi:hypothetical protein
VTDLVDTLAEPRRHDLIGAYNGFRRRLPGLLSEEVVAFVLRWAAGGVGTCESPEDPGAGGGARVRDTDLADGLLDRAFACQDLASVIGPAADFIAAFMRGYHELEVPAALDERDSAGVETDASRANRRMLASALLARHDDPTQAGQVIM